MAGKVPSASVIDSSGLSLPTVPVAEITASLQQPDDGQHGLLRVSPLLGLVVRQEVEMGDANGNDEVDGDTALEARLDLVAEGVLAARRVGDDEKPPIRVAGDRGPRSADTHTRDHERCRGTQANNDRGRDREPDPAQRRRINDEGGDERSDGKDGGDRREDERDVRLRAPVADGAALRSRVQHLELRGPHALWRLCAAAPLAFARPTASAAFASSALEARRPASAAASDRLLPTSCATSMPPGESEQEDLEAERDRDHDVSVHRGDLSRKSDADVSRPWLERSLGASRRRSGDDPISGDSAT